MYEELPTLEQYSAEDWLKAERLSPAILYYKNIIANALPNPTFEDNLRLQRHQNWLRAAMPALLGNCNAQSVCHFWSMAADSHIRDSYQFAGGDKIALGVFALGKLGAQELNLSSDIDIVFVTRENPNEEAFKIAKRIIALISEKTGRGFVHRVDTDLRPGGRLSPLVCSIKQMQDYYWSNGETWERLALTRMRSICGPEDLANDVITLCRKYSYRKFIDYSLLSDLKLLRQQIHHHLSLKNKNDFHLKLAAGGIRDIELFIHSLMIIHGGRNPELQTNSTSGAIERLKKNKLFPSADLDFLLQTYWLYRTKENYVQAINDEQTHLWSTGNADATLSEITTPAASVDRIVAEVIGKTASLPSIPEKQEEQLAWLTGLGFSDRSGLEIWPKILSLTALSSRSIEHEIDRKQVLYKFITKIAQHALDKELALELLFEFFRSIRAKATFFTTLLREQGLIDELSILFGQSPYMGQIIASRPELLDSLLQPYTSNLNSEWPVYMDRLSEEKLVDEIIATKDFLKNFDVSTLSARLSSTADSIVTKIFERLKSELNVKDIQIMALGKWGGQELGFRSDLDFIFLCAGEISVEHNKVAKRFVSRMTEQYRGGQLYSVDLRLRPSGKAGPIIVQRTALHDYLKTSAAAWEKQSYLKSRIISAEPVDVMPFIFKNKITLNDLQQLTEIREKLLRTSTTGIDLKYSPGGIIDIELAVQAALLANEITPTGTSTHNMIISLSNSHADWKENGVKLLKAYTQLRMNEQLHQIVSLQSGSELSSTSGPTQRIAKLQNMGVDELFLSLQNTLTNAYELLKHLDPRQEKK